MVSQTEPIYIYQLDFLNALDQYFKVLRLMLLNQYVFNDFENFLYFNILKSEIVFNNTMSKAFCNVVIVQMPISFFTVSRQRETLKKTIGQYFSVLGCLRIMGVLAKNAEFLLSPLPQLLPPKSELWRWSPRICISSTRLFLSLRISFSD